MKKIILFTILSLLLCVFSSPAQAQFPDGEYKTNFPDGSLQFVSNYKDGKLNGESLQYHENGNLFARINWTDNVRDGKTKLYFKNGQIMEESTYKQGQYHGERKRYYKSGELKNVRTYKDGQLNGKFKEYHANSNVEIEGKARNGLFHGIVKKYDNQGRLSYKGEFKDGNNSGPYSRYYASGIEAETCTLNPVNGQEARRDCKQYEDITGTVIRDYYQLLYKQTDGKYMVKTYVGDRFVGEQVMDQMQL